MTVLKHVVVLVLLAVTVISEEPTSFDPTTEKVPSTEPELACSCLPCSGNSDFYTVHTQSHFCDSAAVIQGRVTQKEVHKTATGLWLQKEHTDHFRRGFPPTHFELTVRVLAIYSNRGDSKLSVGDKITVRYAKTSYCPQCQIKVESFHDESWTDRDLQRGEKYVFFLPILKDGYGDKPEAALSQCTRVWRYSKRGKMIEGWVPLVQRYMLSTTSCDKCRVSGCFQNKCVKVEDDEGCDDPRSVTSQWEEKSCKAIMDSGLCYYHAGSDSCRWTSISDQGYRSRKIIEHCFADEL